MTTISRSASAGVDGTVHRRIAVSGKSESYLGPAREFTPEQRAEIAARNATVAEIDAASEKLRFEANKTKLVENHEMYLPNISDLPLDIAKKSLGIAQAMMRDRDDVGVNVHGRYGDQEITNLRDYAKALKDFIAKLEDASSQPAASESTNVRLSQILAPAETREQQASLANQHAVSQSRLNAASSYSQVQNMFNKQNT